MWLGDVVPKIAERLEEAFRGYCVRGTRYLLGNNENLIPRVGSAKHLIGVLPKTGYWVEVPPSQIQPGDVVVYEKYGTRGAGAKHGHIGIYIGNGRLASDGTPPLISGNYRVYRLNDAGRRQLQQSVSNKSGLYSGVLGAGRATQQQIQRRTTPGGKRQSSSAPAPKVSPEAAKQARQKAVSSIRGVYERFLTMTGLR